MPLNFLRWDRDKRRWCTRQGSVFHPDCSQSQAFLLWFLRRLSLDFWPLLRLPPSTLRQRILVSQTYLELSTTLARVHSPSGQNPPGSTQEWLSQQRSLRSCICQGLRIGALGLRLGWTEVFETQVLVVNRRNRRPSTRTWPQSQTRCRCRIRCKKIGSVPHFLARGFLAASFALAKAD